MTEVLDRFSRYARERGCARGHNEHFSVKMLLYIVLARGLGYKIMHLVQYYWPAGGMNQP